MYVCFGSVLHISSETFLDRHYTNVYSIHSSLLPYLYVCVCACVCLLVIFLKGKVRRKRKQKRKDMTGGGGVVYDIINGCHMHDVAFHLEYCLGI